MSARIGRLRVVVLVEGGDDAVEVAQDLLVHLDEPLLSTCLGRGDDLQDFLALLAVLGQEVWRGDEHRAGQAGFSELVLDLG
ncbi:hypothetical protein ACFV27_38900 [Streptomyces antimycoticus]|uniref:hypothetical protein n=1 Tax=Streptomyces antimycoticus TaxID=68175 RepID=UPI0036CFDEB2